MGRPGIEVLVAPPGTEGADRLVGVKREEVVRKGARECGDGVEAELKPRGAAHYSQYQIS